MQNKDKFNRTVICGSVHSLPAYGACESNNLSIYEQVRSNLWINKFLDRAIYELIYL